MDCNTTSVYPQSMSIPQTSTFNMASTTKLLAKTTVVAKSTLPFKTGRYYRKSPPTLAKKSAVSNISTVSTTIKDPTRDRKLTHPKITPQKTVIPKKGNPKESHDKEMFKPDQTFYGIPMDMDYDDHSL